MRVRVPTVLALVAFTVGACASEAGFDREAALERAMEGGAGLDRAAAECYVDRVVSEMGEEVLAPDAPPNEGLDAAKVAIRIDCVGVSEVGRPGGGGTPPPGGDLEGGDGSISERPPGPWTFGADEDLDALWVDCERGSGAACDELFDRAPLGSDYETFGATCGNRGRLPDERRPRQARPGRPRRPAAPRGSPEYAHIPRPHSRPDPWRGSP